MTEVVPWWPRPDPALRAPLPPGLRSHRHPPNHLHGWVFAQHQVWVDYWGNEHEIESMPLDYVGNVIRFCEERAEQIHQIVYLDALCNVLGDLLVDDPDLARHANQRSLAEEEPLDWLRRTPLLQALERRGNLEGEEKRAMGEQRDPAREEHQYRHPNFRHASQLWLVRCFACSERGTENHVSLISTGVCATCGWQEGDPVYAPDEPEQSRG